MIVVRKTIDEKMGQQLLILWTRPGRPKWMSADEYTEQPMSIRIRLVDVNVRRNRFRPNKITVATTMINDTKYPAVWIRSVYEIRWLVELDLRAVKCSLNMDNLQAKTPDMVRTEL